MIRMIRDFDFTSVPDVKLPHRATVWSGVAMLLGAVFLVIGAVVGPTRTLYAFLAAFCDVLTIALGALLLLMIVHTMNAKWPVPIRRVPEAIAALLVVAALAFLPIAAFVDPIYPWVHPAGRLSQHAQEVLEKKAPWLHVGFFLVRAAFYWIVWLVVARLLSRWSRQQDTSADPALRDRQRALSAGALPLVALTLTFAAFDWMMSLDPLWFSTIYGLDVFAGGFEAAIGLTTVLVVVLDRQGLLAGLVSPSHYYALGRLLLAFVVFWGYIVFFQFFLIWMGNRPEEVEYYTRRLDGGWWVVAAIVIVGHFVVPFLLLLSYRLKRRPERLVLVGGWMVAMHVVDVHWKIVPALDGAAIVHIADLGALLLLGGACSMWIVRWLSKRPVAPRRDPMLAVGTRYFSD